MRQQMQMSASSTRTMFEVTGSQMSMGPAQQIASATQPAGGAGLPPPPLPGRSYLPPPSNPRNQMIETRVDGDEASQGGQPTLAASIYADIARSRGL
mmetsp:Transcript_41027/g.49784  ORF Transcript_41027/g.49784 Transcript_41027/m.49784 type:complete len:97 (-) Transcript_41027:275-565(-)